MTIKNEDHFWMVLFQGKEPLSKRYPTFASAKKDAEELLRMPSYEGCTAHILESKFYGTLGFSPVLWTEASQEETK